MTPFKARYDAIAEQWIALRTKLPPLDNDFFARFVSALPAHSEILDLGCGHGVPIAQQLINAGHQVTGVDRSARLLAVAQQQFPDHQWHLADLTDPLPPGPFNAIVIWDSMFHLPRDQQLALLSRSRDALTADGIILLTTGGSEMNVPPFSDEMFGHSFYYDAYPVPEFLALCRESGFEVEDYLWLNQPDGKRDKGRIGVRLAR